MDRNLSEVRVKIRSRITRVLILVKSDMWTQKSRNMFKNTNKNQKNESSVTEVEELSVQRNQDGKIPQRLRHMIS